MGKSNLIEAFFDGACQPRNPTGHMGMGMYVTKGLDVIKWSDGKPEHYNNSNNVAEYLALIALLEYLQFEKHKVIIIKGDSQLVVKQLNEEWRIKEGRYVEYALLARELLRDLRKRNVVTLKWIPREQNVMADHMSNIGAQKAANSVGLEIPDNFNFNQK